MNRFPELQTDLIFSDTPASEPGATEDAPAPAPAPAADPVETQATTEQAEPLQPAMTGVLEPISGTQVFILVSFGVLAFIMLVAMTRYGSSKNYGD